MKKLLRLICLLLLGAAMQLGFTAALAEVGASYCPTGPDNRHAGSGGICDYCGEPMPGSHTHTKATKEPIPPTCVNVGFEGCVYCQVCGQILTDWRIVPPTGQHTPRTVPGRAPACTEEGLTEGAVCADCGAVIKPQEGIPAKGHTGKTVPGRDSSCAEEGLTEGVSCADCGLVIKAQERIPVKEHNKTVLAGFEATCTQSGFTDGLGCSVCGKVFEYRQLIPKKGHKIAYEKGKPASCDEGGVRGRGYCPVCGITLEQQRTLSAHGHRWSEWQAVNEQASEMGTVERRVCDFNSGHVEYRIVPKPDSAGNGEGSVLGDYDIKLRYDENQERIEFQLEAGKIIYLDIWEFEDEEAAQSKWNQFLDELEYYFKYESLYIKAAVFLLDEVIHYPEVERKVKEFGDNLLEKIKGTKDYWMENLVSPFFGNIKEAIEYDIADIKYYLGEAKDRLGTGWNNFWKEAGYLGGTMEEKFENLVDKFKNKPGEIVGNVEKVMDIAKEAAQKAKEAAEEAARKAKQAAEEKARRIEEEAKKAKEAAEEAARKAKQAAEEKARKAKEAAEEAARKAKQAAEEAARKAEEAARKAAEEAKKTAEKVADTVKETTEKVVEAVKETAEKVGGFFKKLFRR